MLNFPASFHKSFNLRLHNSDVDPYFVTIQKFNKYQGLQLCSLETPKKYFFLQETIEHIHPKYST